jgi:hypothetical protein
MFRWLAALVLLCAGTYAAISYTVGDNNFGAGTDAETTTQGQGRDMRALGASYGGLDVRPLADRQGATNLIVVSDARIQASDRTEVPCEREGRVLFVGTDVAPDTPRQVLEKWRSEGQLYQEKIYFLAAEVDASPLTEKQKQEIKTFKLAGRGEKLYWRWDEEMGVPLVPGRVEVAAELRTFRKLKLGERVERGQLVALTYPVQTSKDVGIKVAKFTAAEANREASAKTRDEAKNRYDGMVKSDRAVPGSVSQDDLRGGMLAWARYTQEEIAKRAELVQSDRELVAALTQLQMHEVRADISGRVRALYKNRGDAVKNLDPVLLIQNTDRLRVEGLVDVQVARRVRGGDPVLVEPTRLEGPRRELPGHLQEVNAVAVAPGSPPLILSGSEDRTLRGWGPTEGQRWQLPYRSAVRAVACTGPDAPVRLAAVGCANGAAQVLPLDRLDEIEKRSHEADEARRAAAKADADASAARDDTARAALLVEADRQRELAARKADEAAALQKGLGLDLVEDDSGADGLRAAHRGAVTCVAFSPDGAVLATGGDDRSIALWDTATGKLLHRVAAAHRSAVTSLQFGPALRWYRPRGRNGSAPLLSAGRDGGVTVWRVAPDEPPVRATEFDRRTSDAAQISTDGRRVLLDQGKEVRLLSLEDRQLRGALQGPPGGGAFSTMALFSPDGRTILTNSVGDARLQLWRAPGPAGGPGTELRQFAWPDGTATCGAFAPDGSFVVTGTTDHQVLIWPMPTREEQEQQLTARVSVVEFALDAGSHQVRVMADLDKAPDWLVPGNPARMIIMPGR